ncbi:MAG: L-lysine 2,3-aminomutase [Microgenomates group bacterium GW2011_GWA2_46_16]|nr:MAG: L-lysine 2,3-aminomutase [Microgenomates group bacterium GW2011_GWA2_46_16]
MKQTMKWQLELRESIRKPTDLVERRVITPDQLPAIEEIHRNFPFSITPYYARLIDWNDPNDPLLRIVTPNIQELDLSGSLDVGGEADNTVEEGVQIKYPSTVLMLPVPVCLAYCRFCFRKRLFDPEVRGEEVVKNLSDALTFIKAHTNVNNVLLTGGDPLVLKTSELKQFLIFLREVDHVKVIRFGTRALPFLPSRITSDPELLELLAEVSRSDKRVYFVNHINHSRELTPEVGEAVDALMKAGVVLTNQAVILRGVNDSSPVLRSLLNDLAAWGITPYYLFQCKFISGSGHFRVPLGEACALFEEATRGLNGLAKRVKFIMAHYSGKIEILGVEKKDGEAPRIYVKYHQAREESLVGRIFSFPLPNDAFWFDDLPGVANDPRFH